MELFTNETMPELLEKSLETARLTDSGWVDVGYELGSSAGRGIDWLTFEDARASVVDDVRRIREHPLVPKRIPIYGYIYNVRTGRLEEVKEATQVGRGIGVWAWCLFNQLEAVQARKLSHIVSDYNWHFSNGDAVK